MIAFSCRQCGMRFKVPDELAGKKARCKKCGQGLQVPETLTAVAAAAATGLFRMGAVETESPQSVAASAGPASIRLAPISLDHIKAVAERERLWEEDDKVEYELDKSVDRRSPPPSRALPQPRARIFWGRGGIFELLLQGLRKVSDYAYLVSVPLLLLLLLAIILKQRELAVVSAVAVIALNLARFCIDGFVLVTLAFKKGPLHGVLFFIPPFTFYYLAKRGKVMKDALGRFLSPALPILAVLLLFIFVPWLRSGDVPLEATVRDRVRTDLRTVRENIETKVRTAEDASK